MSRVGKRPIPLPSQVTVDLKDGVINVKGPKGNLARVINSEVTLSIEAHRITVVPSQETKDSRALQGLTRTLVANMVGGVTEGFTRVLEINGVGYRADVKSDILSLSLGYSHPIDYKLPKGISASVEKNRIVLTGIDKELLGETAAKIRSFRKPEPFKGKGIKYLEEHIQRKAGKSAGS